MAPIELGESKKNGRQTARQAGGGIKAQELEQ